MSEEEAIEIIKRNYEDARGSLLFRDDLQAVDTLEDYIKKTKKEIETLKQNKVIKTLKELSDYDIKIMSEECGRALTPVILDEMKRQIKTDYIPKQKIKDKIEELEENINYLKTFNDWFETDYTNEDIMNNALEVLQELLEEE